jgi:hypothetical protein
VVIVAEAVAGLARTNPPILQPRQAALVKIDAPDSQFPRAENPRVRANEPDEERQGRQQQPGSDAKAPGHHGDGHGGEERRQPRIRESRIGGRQRVAGGASRVQPGPVLLKRGGRHGTFCRISARTRAHPMLSPL